MRKPLALALLAFLCFSLPACQKKAEVKKSGRYGGTVKIAYRSDIPSLDPALSYDTESWAACFMLYDGLVGYGDSTEIVPAIAESWLISDDGKKYAFTLRQGVKFTNGREVEAGDFKYAIERVLEPKTRSYGSAFFTNLVGAREFVDGKAKEVKGLAALDKYHLEISLIEPRGFFLNVLAMPFACAIPREEVAKYPEDFSHHPTGTGAFKLREWVLNQRAVFVRNPDYYLKGIPYLDSIVFLTNVGEELAVEKFERGELSVMEDIPPSAFVRLSTDPKWKDRVEKSVHMDVWFLGMNCRIPPFNNKKVRQAVAYAVDRQKIIKLYNNRGIPAQGVLPPGMPGYDPNLKGYAYDPEKAKALLKEAGFPKGFKTQLVTRNDAIWVKISQAVQQDLATVGIRAEIREVSRATWLDAIGRPAGAPLQWGDWIQDFPDPDDFLNVLYNTNQIAEVNSNNNNFYSNPKVDSLLARAQRLTEIEKRVPLYQEAERIIVEDAPSAYCYHSMRYNLGAPGLHAYRSHPVYGIYFNKMYYE